MAIQLFDEKTCIRIVFNGNTVIVNKSQIKTIEDIRGDTLRLDIGEGALKHIYIRFDEVTLPAVYASRDELKTALVLMMSSAGGGGLINGAGLATEVKQEEEIGLLGQVIQKLDAVNTSIQHINTGSPKEPLMTDESQRGSVYKGFAVINTLTSEPNWAIQKIFTDGLITKYLWADGNTNYDNIWDNRYDLEYSLSFGAAETGVR